MKEQKEKINIFEYVSAFSKLLVAFFIIVTGVTIIPLIVEVSSEGSLMPLAYSISVLISAIWIIIYNL